MELLGTLGIDWRLLVAQLINFAVVLGVLYLFAYPKLVGVLRDRKTRIAKGLADAEAAEIARANAERSSQEIIHEARTQASAIIAEGQRTAEAERARVTAETKDEVANIVRSGKLELERAKAAAVRQAHNDLAELVAIAAERVIGKTITPNIDQALIAEIVAQVERETNV